MGLSSDDVLSKPTEAQRLLAETEETVRYCRNVIAESVASLRSRGKFDSESSVPDNITEIQKLCDDVLLAARESQVFFDNIHVVKTMKIGNSSFFDGPKRLEAMLDGIHVIKVRTSAMLFGFEIGHKIKATIKTPSTSTDETEADRLLRKTEEEVERLKKAVDRYAAILQSKGLTISDASMESATAKQRRMADEVLVAARKNKQIFDDSKLSIEEMSEGLPKFTTALQKMHDDLDRVSREASVINAMIDKGLASKNSEAATAIPVTKATIAEMPPLMDAKDEPEPSTSVVILADGHAFLAIDSVTEESKGYNIRFIMGDGIELNRSDFSQGGIEEFLHGHVAIFNVKEMVFQVVVTIDGQVKIFRKYLLKSANDPKTIQTSLNYALTYLV